MTLRILNICSPAGTGKTTFVESFKQHTSRCCILTPSKIGEVINARDQRINLKEYDLFVFDEFHQWEPESLAKTLAWLLEQSQRLPEIQAVVVSQTELEVAMLAHAIGAQILTIDPRESVIAFNKIGCIVGVNFVPPIQPAG